MIEVEQAAPPAELVLPTRFRKLPKGMAYPPGRFKPVGYDALHFTQQHRWYNRALSWRYEMGSLRTSWRYNHMCAAIFLHNRWHRGFELEQAAAVRAGMERAVWELTGKQINLRKLPYSANNWTIDLQVWLSLM